MDNGRTLIQITPFFGVSDMAAAIAFYRDTMGFQIFVDQRGYGYVAREELAIRLLALDRDAINPPGCGHAYVDVRQVDALFAAMKPRLESLPVGSWGPPKDHPYGQREFWVRDPDGNLIHFGQGIDDNSSQWDYHDGKACE